MERAVNATWGERPFQSGDEIRAGTTRIVYRFEEIAERAVMQTVEAPPNLTRRERDVLIALCRPVLSGDLFTQPASVKQIADELVVTEAAIKQHLLHLYDKFGFERASGHRRVHLANEAVRRGAVRIADVHLGRTIPEPSDPR